MEETAEKQLDILTTPATLLTKGGRGNTYWLNARA